MLFPLRFYQGGEGVWVRSRPDLYPYILPQRIFHSAPFPMNESTHPYYDTIALDFETGGLDATKNPPLSVGAVFRGRTFQRFILPTPGMEMDPVAIEKCGYSPERWSDMAAVNAHTACIALGFWFMEQKKEGARFIVSHNNTFDFSFLFALLIGNMPPFRWLCSQALFLQAQKTGHIPASSTSLDTLCALSGFTGRSAVHDSLQDAHACLHGYAWLLSILRKSPPTPPLPCLTHPIPTNHDSALFSAMPAPDAALLKPSCVETLPPTFGTPTTTLSNP